MNVAITGTINVGKTTLLERVRTELPLEFVYIEEFGPFYTTCPTGLFEFMHRQEEVLLEQINEIDRQFEDKSISIISNGSVIDTFARMLIGYGDYYRYAFQGNIERNIDIIKNASRPALKAFNCFYNYDLLFYLPIMVDYGDVSRPKITNREFAYKRDIDETIRYLLRTFNIEHHTVTGSVKEQRDFVLEKINEMQSFNQ
ncbi:AAA family ATPase [Candidatus Dependentiae bacterium]|nr:AAA family ATPase [Candidatus Dependentiae bacterium]